MANNPDPDFRTQAAAAYQTQREGHRFTSELQARYGWWLITTIAAVHTGAIFFTGSVIDAPVSTKIGPIWAFVVGLVLILGAGLATWVNWGTHAENYARWADARMLVDDEWPKPDAKLNARMDFTYRLSIVLGIASVLCLPLGAAILSCKLA